MGFYSAKKPYHNLKESIANFYKKRVLFMKQLVQKFSEFEKPYVDSSYPEMNLMIPEPQWPTWIRPWVPNPWHPEISMPELPEVDMGPAPTGPWFPPPDFPTGGCAGGCAVMDMPSLVNPGDTILLWITGPWCALEGKTSARAHATLSVTGPGKLTVTSGVTPFLTVLVVDDEVPENDTVCVYAETTEVGGQFGTIEAQFCSACAQVQPSECPEAAEITYTTLVMSGGTTQTLYSSDGLKYWWKVTDILGSTTKTYGNSKLIQAPVTNPGCEQIEVIMSIGKSDSAEECDSIAIDVTIPNCTEYSRPSFNYCCHYVWDGGNQGRCCFTSYDCEGVMVTDANSTCCSPGMGAPEDCSSVIGCELAGNQCADSLDCSASGSSGCMGSGTQGEEGNGAAWQENRTAQMIEDGCCPGLTAGPG